MAAQAEGEEVVDAYQVVYWKDWIRTEAELDYYELELLWAEDADGKCFIESVDGERIVRRKNRHKPNATERAKIEKRL